MVSKTLTAESTNEQGKAGLTDCTPEEFATHPAAQRRLQREVRLPLHPRGARAARHGPDASARSSTPSSAGCDNHPDFELAECLRNIHRIAEIRLDDKFGVEPAARQPGVGLGRSAGRAQRPRLRRARPAHRHLPHRRAPRLRAAARATGCARLRLRRGRRSMRSATSSASTTAATRGAKRLLTGSHYDTVRNGGKYDGRLGIFVPMACVRELHAPGPAAAVRLRGGRLRRRGRPALQGDLPRLGRADRPLRPGLARPEGCRRRHDARGDAARRACASTTSRSCSATRPKYLGFVEVHIEQGPVLNELDLPLGIVTSINGSVRYVGEVDRHGQPRRHHADGPPPRRRGRGGRAGALSSSSAPRRCRDLGRHRRHARGAERLDQRRARAAAGSASTSARTNDAQRDACAADVLAELEAHLRAARRCATRSRRRMRAAAAPSAPRLAAALGARGRRRSALPLLPHAQRRRPRRDEAARGDAAGDAVRARPQLRHQPQPARIDHQRRHRSCAVRRLPAPARPTRDRTAHEPPTDYDKLDAWIDAHFDEEVRFLQELVRVPTDTPPGNNAPHAERTAELLAGLRLRGREARGARRPRCEADGLESITNLIVRRRYGDGPDRSRSTRTATWCRRARAGRTTPTAARSSTASSTAAPRRSARATSRPTPSRVRALESLGAAAARAASSCTSPTTRSSAASSAPAGCCSTG